MAASLWVKVAATLPRHPKLLSAAEMLSISRAELLGRLVLLWIYALEFRGDGTFESREEIAQAMEWPREDAARLVAALQLCGGLHCGFIERPSSDGVHVALHHWQDYSGVVSDSQQKRRKREDKKEDQIAAPLNFDLKSNDGTPIPRDKNHEAWLKKLGVI